MRWFRRWTLRLRAALSRPRVEREMEAELAEHLECETRELMARGVPETEARIQARTGMGRMETIKEDCRDARGTAAWERLRQDVRFALRLLAVNRTFSSMALATMALAIGSTTAIYSLIDGVLLRPLPFPAPERLFFAGEVGMRGPFDVMRSNSRLADYAAYVGVHAFNVAGRDWPERVKGCEVSANFFEVLGAGPLMGRTFAAGEDRPGKLREAVLGHDFWVERYGARPEAIGQGLMLDGAAYQVIGVMPKGFSYPRMNEARFWVPMRLDPRDVGEYWGAAGVMSIARLRPGVEAPAANAELRAWIPRIRGMFPWRMPDAWGLDARLTGLRDHLVEGVRVKSLLLLAVAALVLLIAIVNVANLMIGQTAARQGELALRASLGATAGRLARQLLTESLVLAGAGGLLGTLLAFAELAWLKHLLPADTPRLAEVTIDGRILAFAAAISLGSGLLFGLLPAVRMRFTPAVGIEGARATQGTAAARTGSALVMTEAAFATILLVGAGLLLHSLWTLLHVNPGFRVESLVTAELSPGRPAAGSLDRTLATWERVREKIAGYPGMLNVAAMNVLPLTPEVPAFSAAIEDHPRPPQAPAFVLWATAATPDHLATLGIRLLQGRGFTAADRMGAPFVAMVSRATAQRFWPNQSPLGKRVKPVWDRDWRTIVGVVEDVKNFSMSGPPEWVDGEVYLPLAQSVTSLPAVSVVARLGGDAAGFEQQLPALVQEACAACAVGKIARMETIVAGAVEAPKSLTWLVGGFAALALLLAAAGIYGVVSHGVLRRTRELGVRIALGARRSTVAWMVVAASLRSALIGALVGLGVSWALVKWMKSLLFGVAEHDAFSFALPPVVLVALAVLAGLVPALRALRIDPARSLREG